MLGKIVLPVEFCNRNTLKSDRISKISLNAASMGFEEVAEKLQHRRNPLYGLLRQCQLVDGRYQEYFGEMIFHPIHPYLYTKRYQLQILRLFEGDITEYPISTLSLPKGKEARTVYEADGKILYWGVASKLSQVDDLLFGHDQQDVLLPGDVANIFGVECFKSIKSSAILNAQTFGVQ